LSYNENQFEPRFAEYFLTAWCGTDIDH
jgi:hypothetical protein